jgi:hypothetical protein
VAKLKTILATTGFVTGGLLYIVVAILGLLLHLWTILIAFGYSGIIAALISLVFPVIAELYWAFYSWKAAGTIVNTYCVSLGVYAIMFIVSILIVGLSASKLED